MKAKKLTGLLLALSLAFTTVGTSVIPVAAQEMDETSVVMQGRSGESRITALKDVSLDAKAISDYTPPWQDVNGIKTDWEPTASSGGQAVTGWGNWSQNPGSEHYVQYDWDEEITTEQMQLYWFDDTGDTRPAATLEVQYKDDSGEYVNANMTTSFETLQEINQYNTIEFDEITTTSIKLVMTVRSDAKAIGIHRWKVLAKVPMSEREVLELDKNSLAVPATVKENSVELATQSVNGYDVTWTSDSDVIKIENGRGIITREEQAVTVNLTATITGKEVITPNEPPLSVSRVFPVYIPAIYLSREATVTGSYEGSYGEVLSNINDEDNRTAWNGHGRAVPDKDWVQYDFQNRVELTGFTINCKDDGGGVIVPKSISFEYFDAKSTTWKTVVPVGGEWVDTSDVDRTNTYTFDRIVTDKIKLIIENGTNKDGYLTSTYIYEWALNGRRWTPTKTDLQEFVSETQIYKDNKSEYTAATFAAFEKALDAAQAAIEEEPTQTEIATLIVNLETAIGKLRFIHVEAGPGLTEEKKDLAIELSAAGEKTESSYTAESWADFNKAYNDAFDVNSDSEATQDDIDAALEALQTAVTGLVIRGSSQELQIELQRLPIPNVIYAGEIATPSTNENGFALSWESDNDAVKIENEKGIVTRGETAVEVTLTVTITAKDIITPDEPPLSISKDFPVTVPAIYLAREATVSGSHEGLYAGLRLEQINDEDEETAWNGHRGNVSDSDWIQYDFQDVLELTGATIIWFDNVTGVQGATDGVMVPDSIVFEYYDEDSETWKEAVPMGDAWAYVNGKNTYAFEKIVTKKIKLVINNGSISEDKKLGTYINEWALTGKKVVLTKDDLQTAIENAKTYKENLYTAESFLVLTQAITNAEEIAEKSNPTTMEIMRAINALQAAIDGLDKKSGETNNVDKSLLTAAIASVEDLTKEDYTEESWGVLEEALKTANDLNTDENATQAQVNAAVRALNQAIEDLETVGGGPNKAALTTAISKAEKLTASDYTTESWAAVERALEAARNLAEDATQAAVNKAAKDLNDAMETLVKKGETPGEVDKTDLNKAISDAKALNKDAYTAESWAAVETALTNAENLAEDVDQETVDAATKALTDAMDALVQKDSNTVPATQESIATLTNSVNAAAKNYKKGNYTDATWNAFEKALKDAQDILNNKAATEAQVTAAKKNLEDAIKALVQLKVTKKNVTLGLKETYSVKAAGCTYTTSDPKVADVNKTTGKVTTKKTGNAVIKAINNATGNVTEYTVTVKKAPKKISKVTLNKKAIKKKKATLKKGKSATLKVTLPKGTASNKITYKSSKTKVATVSANGKIKAKKKGKTKITIKTFNNKKMVFTLTVN